MRGGGSRAAKAGAGGRSNQPIPLQQGIIYGPVRSRRLGRSLGVNLLPSETKVCSFNCCYCQYGWTQVLVHSADPFAAKLPTLAAVRAAVRAAFADGPDFDYITFSGNGEPTLHPEFPEIVEAIRVLREQCRPEVQIAVLSNSSTCMEPLLQAALERCDLPIMKLDAGNARMFRRMNHGVPQVAYEAVVAGLSRLRRCVIQTMFVRGSVDNSTDEEVASWAMRLAEIQPDWVQIYTLDRGPADARLQRVSAERLHQIGQRVEQETGIHVDVCLREDGRTSYGTEA